MGLDTSVSRRLAKCRKRSFAEAAVRYLLDKRFTSNRCSNQLNLYRYSPDYNGVESVISQVKHWVKRERLSRVLKGQAVDIAELIEIGF